jgi:hypothetical protein
VKHWISPNQGFVKQLRKYERVLEEQRKKKEAEDEAAKQSDTTTTSANPDPSRS